MFANRSMDLRMAEQWVVADGWRKGMMAEKGAAMVDGELDGICGGWLF